MLLDLGDNVQGLRNRIALAGDADGVVDGGQLVRIKLNVQDGPDDLDDVTDGCLFLRHGGS
jgi:hypothetical protein